MQTILNYTKMKYACSPDTGKANKRMQVPGHKQTSSLQAKHRLFLLACILLLFPASIRAQLEKVIVEKYYVSDRNDATDTTGGILKPGSVTYRVYVDMQPGYKLTKIFGNAYHAFKITSDSVFYNNTDRGEVFAYNLLKSSYGQSTVALDTWLTLGKLTKNINSPRGPYAGFGVLKPQDRNGSFVGGANNDGGSQPVANGLLTNADPGAGIPLTTKDGIDTMNTIPAGWLFNPTTGLDSSIFGSAKPGNRFVSNDFFLQNNGVNGVIMDSNQVLIAQLTTRGKISFELNVEIVDTAGNIFNYVARKGADSSSQNVLLSPYLIYPLVCGCNDANYKEYDPAYACLEPSACKTPIVLGCMDPLSCNYNPRANLNVPELCCYPGFCNDRDLNVVCPSLGVSADLYPDPVASRLSIRMLMDSNQEVTYTIYDFSGRLVMSRNIGIAALNSIEQVDVSGLISGLYLLRLSSGENVFNKKFIKN